MRKYIKITIGFFMIVLVGGSVSYHRLAKELQATKEQCLVGGKEMKLLYDKSQTRGLSFDRAIEQSAMLHVVKNVDGKYPSGEELSNNYYSIGALLGYMSKSLDTWGMPYRCETIPVLISSGADGMFDTEDDIVVRVESPTVSNMLFEIKRDIPDIEDEFREARKALGVEIRCCRPN